MESNSFHLYLFPHYHLINRNLLVLYGVPGVWERMNWRSSKEKDFSFNSSEVIE